MYRKKVEQALERIEAGEFGVCEDCGADIGFNRLKARPTASLCIGCKEEQEKEEKQKLYSMRSHTTGRQLASELSNTKFGDEKHIFGNSGAKILEFSAAGNN